MQLQSIKANFSGSTTKKTFRGESHLVLPVIIMVEGVHCGSSGCLLYTADELSRTPEGWNGRPVPVKHPMNNGTPVSCNSPDIYESQVIGYLWNTKFDSGKLKSEIWVNEKICQASFPDVYAKLNSGRMMEVSTGLFSEAVEGSGEWNGKSYSHMAVNIVPDHLALLPDEIGACSITDGCGAPRINNKGGDDMDKTSTEAQVERTGLKKALSTIGNVFGFNVEDKTVGDGPTSPQTQNEENSMSDDTKKVLVDAIINAKQTYEESDREFLNIMCDTQLKKINDLQRQIAANAEKTDPEKKEPEKAAPEKDPKPVANAEPEKKEPMTINADALKVLSEQIVSQIEKVLPGMVQKSIDANEASTLVADLVANKECPLGEGTLKTLPLAELKKMHGKFVGNATDFSLLGGMFAHSSGEDKEVDKAEMPGILANAELWKQSNKQ